MRTNELTHVKTAEQAGNLLAQKLWRVMDMDAIVVAVTPAAMPLTVSLARVLHLPVEALPSRVVRDPADAAKVIGSVTVDAVSCLDDLHDIPRDYVAHQLLLLQCAVRKEYESYYARRVPSSFQKKTVILVDETISAPHPMSACLISVVKQRPLSVIVVAQRVTAEAARRVGEMVGQIEYLEMINDLDARLSYAGYTDQQQDRAKAIFETYIREFKTAQKNG